MKKRLLSLVLCLVMVFSLFPAINLDALAIDRPYEGYVEINNTNWTPQSNYDGTSYGGTTNTLYYQDADGNYWPVTVDRGDVFTATSVQNWKPTDISGATAGTYYYSANEQTFDVVSTTRGTGYEATTQQFDNGLFSQDIDDYHTRKYVFTTNYYVKYEKTDGTHEYRRLMAQNRGILASWGNSFSFGITLFYYSTEPSAYASDFNTDSNIISVYGDGLIGRSKKNESFYSNNAQYLVPVAVNGSTDEYNYRRHGVGYKDEMYDTYYTTVGETLYRKITIDNSIVYGSNKTRLPGSSIVYDTDTTAWNGKLYTVTHQQPYKLSYTDDNGTHELGQTKLSNGQIYGDKLFYFSDHAVMPQPSPTSIITTEETGEDGVYTHKELTANGDAYDVTLTAYTTGNKVTTSTETITPTVKPMDIVMVIDQSGSMATRDMGNTYAAAATPSGGWTVDAATGGKQYYYTPDNGLTYYPVQADTGYVYEKVEGALCASDMLGNGDDAISLGVNGAPTYYNISTDYYVMYNGEMHRLRLITAGLFLQYGLYPYIYTNEQDPYAGKGKWEGNNYWVAVFDPWEGSDLRDNKVWNSLTDSGAASSRVSFVNTDGQAIGSTDGNANTVRLSYSWFTSSDSISNLYQLSGSKVANQLYYVDAGGTRHNIGSTAKYANDVVYTGTLYEGNSESRVDALKAAVTQFANAVEQNALTNPDHPVDHRMAFVGFAGNKVPAYSLGSDAVTVGSNGLADYTNTGLFLNGGFKNYEKITGYERTTDQYINRHYYQNNMPVKYSDGWQRLNLETGATTSTYYSSSNWYKATYEGNGTSLSAADYRAALVSVNDTGALNSSISNVISQFAANGGTYTSYGMSMAEQLYRAVDAAGDTEATDSEGQPAERQRVIIVFTDGEPGANGYNSSIAGEALAAGNTVQLGKDGKAGTEDDVLIYTVGLFKSSPSAQVADFMQKLSSEYQLSLTPVYGGEDNDNNSLGSLNPNKTYYYKNETTGKYYAVTTEYGNGSSLGWWIYNGSHSGSTESYSLTNPRRSTGAGTTVFYNANGSSVNGEDVVTGRTYYTSNGDKIVYEYRWFDSDRSIKNPALQSGQSTSAGEARVQFYDLAGAVANDDGLSYYLTASNAAELNNVFAQIAGSLVKEEVTVESGSVYTEETMYVMDEISADFDLPSDFSAANNHVTVYADTVSEWNNDRTPKTYNISTTPLRQGNKDAIEAGNADVEVVWNGKKLQINYFDFGRMYMQESNPNAARIRVVIDGITPNRAGDANVMSDLNPYADNESGNALGALKSNTAQSGLYYKDPESGAVTLVEAFKVPSAPVPGHTVTWVDDQGTNMANPYDQDTDLIKGSKPVYDGGEPTKDSVVVENVSRTDYTFDGWSTTPGGEKVIDDIVRNAETGVVTDYGTFPPVVDSDVTYYAHFASEVKNFYTATWFNGTTQLFEQKGLANGDVPEYGGKVPAKNADDDYTYFFAGWYDEAAHTRNGETYVAADVITQLPPINGADVNYYAVFAPVQIETRNIILQFNTKTLIKGETVTGFDAMNTPGGDFTLEKAENAASGDFFFTPGTQRNTQYQPAEAGKYIFDVTGFSEVNTAAYYEGDKPTKVNVIPAADIYFDDNLLTEEADLTKTDKSGDYKDEERVDQSDIPAVTATKAMEKGRHEITFIGTGIDVYCTTDTESGYIQAMVDGNANTMQSILNRTNETTRYNVPTVSFQDLAYGEHTLVLNILSSSKYKLDGIRVYGAMNDQSQYAGTHEQYAAYINMREALVNNTGISQAFSDSMEDAVLGALFVDDTSKLKLTIDTTTGEEPTDSSDPKHIVEVYKNAFEAYQKNSPKHEIYLDNGEAIIFQLSEAAETAAANGNLWIGLSAPDQNKNAGTVTLKEGKTINVTSAVDMYYPITSDMIGTGGVVTITNTGDNMISVTNLKITGNEAIYNAANTPKAGTASVSGDAGALSVEDAIPLVFEPVTMQTVKVAANHGVDPDAPASTDPTPTPAPDPTPDPTDNPGTQNWLSQLISSFVNALFKSIARLFNP